MMTSTQLKGSQVTSINAIIVTVNAWEWSETALRSVFADHCG
jgi:hypothetical protein